MEHGNRSYWVVSPNVRNTEATVSDWRQASVDAAAAFMGYGPDETAYKGSGIKFAQVVKPGDVILIARRHNRQPEMVGFGRVRGKYLTGSKGLRVPGTFGSLRKLSPFVPWSQAPKRLPLLAVLPQNLALAQLHPEQNKNHERVCRWMDVHLSKVRPPTTSAKHLGSKKHPASSDIQMADPPGSCQLDYQMRTQRQIRIARAFEARLLRAYRDWLNEQNRKLGVARYNKLHCDGFEIERNNLIEAKSSCRREHIRMAVGQLLDYSFQGKAKFGNPHLAILLPAEPDSELTAWLNALEIAVIWRSRGRFFDNANGQFT